MSFNLKKLISYLYLFYTNCNFAFIRLYLNETFYLITSSEAELNSKLNISINLYSKFSIKSNFAAPSYYIKNTQKKLYNLLLLY